MRLFRSLAGRLVASLILVTVAFGVAAATWGSMTLRREINEAMDSSMRDAARRLLPLVVDDLFGRDPQQSPRRLAESVSDDEGAQLIFQVRDGTGRVLIHSYDALPEPLTSALTPGFSDEAGWRIYTEAAVSGTIFVQVAERETQRDKETLEAATGFLVPMVVLTPLSAIVAWLVLSRFLRPVTTLRGEISARHGDDLSPIRTDGLPTELAAIAKSVNSLMRRLRMALHAEKEFTANAAHELRTPLAGALAQTERLIAETRDEAAQARAMRVKTALSNLANLSEKLLQLARADAGMASGGPTDLALVAKLVVADLEQHEENRDRLRLELPAQGAVKAAIDTDALAIVLRNLVENALRHGAEGGKVTVRIGGDASLAVTNDGPVVPVPNDLVKRFERGATRSGGSGLGLAIVARILQQVDATLVLNSPVPGRKDGFEAQVRFPAG